MNAVDICRYTSGSCWCLHIVLHIVQYGECSLGRMWSLWCWWHLDVGNVLCWDFCYRGRPCKRLHSDACFGCPFKTQIIAMIVIGCDRLWRFEVAKVCHELPMSLASGFFSVLAPTKLQPLQPLNDDPLHQQVWRCLTETFNPLPSLMNLSCMQSTMRMFYWFSFQVCTVCLLCPVCLYAYEKLHASLLWFIWYRNMSDEWHE